MLESEKKVTEMNEEELGGIAGGYASLGPGVKPGVTIKTRICPECGATCKVRIDNVTQNKCSSCGCEL